MRKTVWLCGVALLLTGCNPFQTRGGTSSPADESIISLTFNVSASVDNQVTTGDTAVTTGETSVTTGSTTLSNTPTLDASSEEVKGGGDKKE